MFNVALNPMDTKQQTRLSAANADKARKYADQMKDKRICQYDLID